MKVLRLILCCVAGLVFLAGCQEIQTDAVGKNTSALATRLLTGNLSAVSADASVGEGDQMYLSQASSSSCVADTVMATDTSGETLSEAVAGDCSFALSLAVGKSYVVSFLKDDAFVATLLFQSGISGLTSSVLPVSDGDAGIDLGTVVITGTVAEAEHNPSEQCDYDSDGESDYADLDDDNDLIADDEEQDCDLDGVADDHDDELSSCEDGDDDDGDSDSAEGDDDDESGMAFVLDVRPYNYLTMLWEERIDLDREVKARLSCAVDVNSVIPETFSVVSEDGSHTVSCAYEFSRLDKQIECDHDEDEFLPDTVYVAVVDGVLCADGRTLVPTSWIWLTEEEDDDIGTCYEDEYDEEIEEESEDPDSE